jgi:hypothetical protein
MPREWIRRADRRTRGYSMVTRDLGLIVLGGGGGVAETVPSPSTHQSATCLVV